MKLYLFINDSLDLTMVELILLKIIYIYMMYDGQYR